MVSMEGQIILLNLRSYVFRNNALLLTPCVRIDVASIEKQKWGIEVMILFSIVFIIAAIESGCFPGGSQRRRSAGISRAV